MGNEKSNMVTINLAGKYLGNLYNNIGVHDVMMILMLAYDTKMGCLLKIKVKTDN